MVNLFHFYVNILLCYTFLLEFVYPVLLDRSFCLFICLFVHLFLSNFRIDFPGGSVVKNLPAKCRRCGFDPWVGKIPAGGGNSNSSILTWVIPRTEEPGGLQSMGSQSWPCRSTLKHNFTI